MTSLVHEESGLFMGSGSFCNLLCHHDAKSHPACAYLYVW